MTQVQGKTLETQLVPKLFNVKYGTGKHQYIRCVVPHLHLE